MEGWAGRTGIVDVDEREQVEVASIFGDDDQTTSSIVHHSPPPQTERGSQAGEALATASVRRFGRKRGIAVKAYLADDLELMGSGAGGRVVSTGE